MTTTTTRPIAEHTYDLALESPIGTIVLRGDERTLVQLFLPSARPRPRPMSGPVPAPVAKAARQLDEYFAGTRRTFSLDFELDGTEFQRRVWLALAEIPYGETVSYGELARAVGHPNAYRAVGSANGANPLAIILPCHRVIASDGSLGGYGGGLPTKQRLLDLERGVAEGRKRGRGR
jgi:methylated-DNA-[protein]-cysteine S-methyltransferase